MLGYPLPKRKLQRMTSTVQNEWNNNRHPPKSAKEIKALPKQAVHEWLFHQWELECVFHRVSRLHPQAASIYLPIDSQCNSSFLQSPGKPSNSKDVMKACPKLRACTWCECLCSSCDQCLFVLAHAAFFPSVERSGDYSAAASRFCQQIHTWACVLVEKLCPICSLNLIFWVSGLKFKQSKGDVYPCKWVANKIQPWLACRLIPSLNKVI